MKASAIAIASVFTPPLPPKFPPTYPVITLTLAWGIFSYQFLDLMPIAQRTVLAGMTDAVIVLDAWDRVVDLNRPAQTLIAPDQGL